MKQKDVVLHHVYAVKVSGRVVPVKLMREASRKTAGWTGLNLLTNREVVVRTAAKLRFELHQCPGLPAQPCGKWIPVTHALCWTRCMKAHRLSQDPGIKKSDAVLDEAKAVLATYHEALGHNKNAAKSQDGVLLQTFYAPGNAGHLGSECRHCASPFVAHTDGVCPTGKAVSL